MSKAPTPRETLYITHPAPEDNDFALWLSSKLAIAGYRVWIDRNRLRGGDDFWDEIDRVLRMEAIKQIVVFSRNVGKPGVKKELAIGDVVRRTLSDPSFMIPIRIDATSFSSAPPEFLRDNILNAYPNWHDCLHDVLEALSDAGIPRAAAPDAEILQAIVHAREDGRRFVLDQGEEALTNWFAISPPSRVRYYRFEGLQGQMEAWLAECRVPFVATGRLAGSFVDPVAFSAASSFLHATPTAYDVGFSDFICGEDLGPHSKKTLALNDVANLFRQHFDLLAKERGLQRVEFANGETGWYFPDGIVPDNRVVLTAPDGRRIRRTMSGKFKNRRWHLCLVARPRIWPQIAYRIHGNVVLSAEGRLLPGDKTHRVRRRLTRSWWNDIWRDRLIAAMHFLADGKEAIAISAGHERLEVARWPIAVKLPVSYEATDPPLVNEEDDRGTIVPTASLDDFGDGLEEDSEDGAPGESA